MAGSRDEDRWVRGAIHDHELETGEGTVRALLASQCPDWAGAPLRELDTTGTDNAMWRTALADRTEVVVRLPRQLAAATKVEREVAVLDTVATTPLASLVHTPIVHHRGEPEDAFPHAWSVLEWIDGVDAWTVRDALADDDDGLVRMALELADAVRAIRAIDALPVGRRARGERGGPIEPLLRVLDWWLTDPQWDAASFVDVDAVRRVAAEAAEVADEPVVEATVHGDLIPGNVLLAPLIATPRLTAIIDWTSAAVADPAQDLAPAWAIFDGRSRDAFGEAVGADEAMWRRARAFGVEQAVGGIVYYGPRAHPLGDVMRRTLDRILAEPVR